MKIKTEHYAFIEKEIRQTLDKYGSEKLVELYEIGEFPRSEKVNDLQKRFCFDLMFGAGLSSWICDNIYTYASDDHLYTALKRICPKVTKRY